MKSLKNKKCVVCGKPATIWLPSEEDDIELPYCERCCDQAMREIIEREDEEDDDSVLLGGVYDDDGLDLLV